VEFAQRVSNAVPRLSPATTLPTGDRAPRALSKVVLSLEGKTVAELHLVPGRKIIGRTPDNDLQVDSKFVSRHHCQLITGSDGITVIEDLNSTNGILLRGNRVRRQTLRDGDVIVLGQHEMLYVDEASQQHLADTQDDLKALDADAANEEADETQDSRGDAAGAG
jgi:general secretion pathway protein A